MIPLVPPIGHSSAKRLALVLFLPWVLNAALSDSEIQDVRAGGRQRNDAFFQADAGKPFVPAAINENWNNRGDFTRHYNQSVMEFAFRSFQLRQQLPEANQALREMCQYHLDRPQTLLEIHSFPWTLSLLPQLCRLYGPEGTRAQGLISTETHAILLRTMWEWAREKSQVAAAETKQSQTWYITDSENHHANHFASCWATSMVLAQIPEYRDRPFADGHTAREHFAGWTAYLREYVLERARKGMTIEIDSPSYATTTLRSFYLIFDLTDDPILRKRASDYITLFWALWAEHQIDGVGGGAKTRTYAASAQRGSDFTRRAAWYALGQGEPRFVHASMLPFVLTSWEMPDVLIDLALDTPGRGTYEIRQRRMGLAEPGYSKPGNYRMRTEAGGIVRYGYCTPDFIMGSLLTEARPEDDWAAISSQNRWTGVIFRGDPDARIYPATFNRDGESIYNGHWTAQSAGTLIAQKLPTSRRADEWRIWFSKAGLSAPRREGRWVFAESPGAFAAVHVARGDFSLPDEAVEKFGRWLVCNDETSPVIIEVMPKNAYESMEAFRRAVLARPVAITGEMLTYGSLRGDRFSFPVDQSTAPLINGHPVNLTPRQVYESPFVQSAWNSGIVILQKGNRSLTLDFNR
jgi:hypothetical protein